MRLYLDTSVFSAYFDDRTPERMEMTRAFWSKAGNHELLCSDLTTEEIDRASSEKKQSMHTLMSQVRFVAIDKAARDLAQAYVQQGVVNAKYFADALHIAAAVLADADIIVSWNFEHLVKRGTRLLVNYVNATRGLRAIEILAPPEI